MEKIINPFIEKHFLHLQNMMVLLECYELRLCHINRYNSYKDEYRKNEDDILRMNTEIKINKLRNEIDYQLNQFHENFFIYINELNGANSDINGSEQ